MERKFLTMRQVPSWRQMNAKLKKLYTGAMKGHTMYVIPYLEIERKHGVRSNLAAACLAQVSLP